MINITIIGVGAMGCLFGARLHPFANVTLLGSWQAQLHAIQAAGLRVDDENGRSHHPLTVTDNPATIPPADLVLILVKSHQTERAAQQASNILKADGLALTLQNGVGNLEKLTAVLGVSRATVGVTSAGAMVTGTGKIRVAGLGHTHLASTGVTIAPLFERAGLPTTVTDDVDGLIWGKLAINAGINPVTAVLNVPNGYLTENEEARAMMIAAARETQAVAGAMGITLPYSDAGARALDVARKTAVNRSSMLQDVQRGARTEIEASLKENGRLLLVSANLWQLLAMIFSRKKDGKKGIGGYAPESAQDLQFLSTLAEAGEFTPYVDKQFPLEHVSQAHAYVEAGHKLGNVVIVVKQSKPGQQFLAA